MKQISRVLFFILALGSLLISACGTAASPAVTPVNAAANPSATPLSAAASPSATLENAAEVAFLGVIELIDGTQWTINAQTITVDPTVVRDGPFNVGDTIKIEGVMNSDGSFVVTRVESPTAEDLSSLPQLGNDNTNDGNINDNNSNDGNSSNGNTNDDNSNGGGGNDNGGGGNDNGGGGGNDNGGNGNSNGG